MFFKTCGYHSFCLFGLFPLVFGKTEVGFVFEYQKIALRKEVIVKVDVLGLLIFSLGLFFSMVKLEYFMVFF